MGEKWSIVENQNTISNSIQITTTHKNKNKHNRYQNEKYSRNRFNNTIVLNDTNTEENKNSSSRRQKSTSISIYSSENGPQDTTTAKRAVTMREYT